VLVGVIELALKQKNENARVIGNKRNLCSRVDITLVGCYS